MKRITLLIALSILLLNSCKKNKTEQMLFNYVQDEYKKQNFDINDLDFKIKDIKQISNIKASDSMLLVKKELAIKWKKNPPQSLIDTLSFKFVKNIINKTIESTNKLIDTYQKAVIFAIKNDDYSYKIESEEKRDKNINDLYDYKKMLSDVEKMEKYYINLSKKPDSILSVRYKAVYSIKNPMLNNVKQTYNKYFYTNANQTKFIKVENEIE